MRFTTEYAKNENFNLFHQEWQRQTENFENITCQLPHCFSPLRNYCHCLSLSPRKTRSSACNKNGFWTQEQRNRCDSDTKPKVPFSTRRKSDNQISKNNSDSTRVKLSWTDNLANARHPCNTCYFQRSLVLSKTLKSKFLISI